MCEGDSGGHQLELHVAAAAHTKWALRVQSYVRSTHVQMYSYAVHDTMHCMFLQEDLFQEVLSPSTWREVLTEEDRQRLGHLLPPGTEREEEVQ